MAMVTFTPEEAAEIVATLRKHESETVGHASPLEIIAAVEQWEADKIERRDWSDLTVHQMVQIGQQIERDRDARDYLRLQEVGLIS